MSTNKIDIEFKTKLLEFARHTSFVAIPNIFLTKFISFRIIYTISLVIGIAGTGWFAVLSLDKYMAREIKTKVTLEKNDPRNTDFPSVTICNLQICGFTDYRYEQQLDKYNETESEKLGSDQSAFVKERLRKNQTKTSFYQAQEIFLRLSNDSQLEANLNNPFASIKSMLISCRFGDFPDNRSYCDETDFKAVSIGEFRKCYQFNFASNETTKPVRKITGQQGRTSGLQLQIYLGNESQCQSPLTTTAGLMIYVHSSTYTLSEEDYAVEVPPGKLADIYVQRTELNKKPAPYSNCFKSQTETEIKDIIVNRTIEISPFKIYTQQYCMQICYEDFLIHFCDCYDNSIPFFGEYFLNNTYDGRTYETCPKFIDSIYNCEFLIKKLFYNGINDADCLKRCPKECDSVSFKTTVSYEKFPSLNYIQLLKSNYTTNYILNSFNNFTGEEKDLIAVNIFYKNQMFEKIEEQPAMETGIFLVNFGGVLGLFLGCSILSFGELVEILLEYIIYLFKKYKV